MKKYGKEMAVLTAQLLVFYAFPLTAGSGSALGMVLLMLAAALVLGGIMGLVSGRKIKYAYPLVAAVLFIPSVFIYYNESAWVHSIWYFVMAFVGLAVGALARCLFAGKGEGRRTDEA